MKTDIDPNFEYKDDNEFGDYIAKFIGNAMVVGFFLAIIVICLIAYFINWLSS